LLQEFYLVEQLGATHEAMPHLKAAVFVRPTSANIDLLKRELADPKFKYVVCPFRTKTCLFVLTTHRASSKANSQPCTQTITHAADHSLSREYHLFFSNVLGVDLLRSLADADEHEVVKQVHEFYGDFIAVNEDLFTLNMDRSLHLTVPTALASAPDSTPMVAQSVQGVLAMLLSMKVEPSQIRFQGRSQVAHRVAMDVHKAIQADGIYNFTRQEGPMVLILDRMDDPVTPLLSQWTYQAMVHELLGLNRNRVVLKGAPGVREDLEEVRTSRRFFHAHL
jgi:vacuolar protein sorting-associated protein 45